MQLKCLSSFSLDKNTQLTTSYTLLAIDCDLTPSKGRRVRRLGEVKAGATSLNISFKRQPASGVRHLSE